MTYDSWKLACDPEVGEKATEAVKKPYLLQAADKCGVFREDTFETFEELLAAYRAWPDTIDTYYNPCAFLATNLDRCDLGDDGLTEDEREQL